MEEYKVKEESASSSLRKDPMIHNALGSATAGIVARLCTHPLDTAKARLQAQGSTFRGPLDALSLTFSREGIRGLYRGFPAVIFGGTPGTMVYLCGYDIFKERLGRIIESRRHEHDTGSLLADEFGVHFMSGMLAETVACVVYVPVDVVKERMQVQNAQVASSSSVLYRNSWDALKQIARNEGLRGVYKGYYATLASFGPFSALYFVFYEQFKDWSRQRLQTTEKSLDNVEISFPYLLFCSSSAGALASWLTSPLDMAKLRLQIQRGRLADSTQTSSMQQYRGVLDCLQTAYRQGGVRGLFRGAGARVLHFAPATTLTMTCYETFRSFFARHLGDTQDGVS